MDLERLRDKCERLQWTVDDVDWDAPGALEPDRAQDLSGFLADLYWIESIAELVFRAMAERTDDPTTRAVFESFAVDERRHADAELALMVRWGILRRGELPHANRNAANLLRTLERSAHHVHPSVFSAIIPMTELVLDGALVRHLLLVVDDPICHEAFAKINADEARHLAMDFHMLEHYGREYSALSNALDLIRSFARPSSMYAMFFGYMPMLARGRSNIERIGLDLAEVRRCFGRYVELGAKNPDIARHPTYRLMRAYAQSIVDQRAGFGDTLVRLTDAVARL